MDTRGQSPADRRTLEKVWLLGQPHLSDYLDFVKDKVVDGEGFERRLLADEWRAANDRYHDLESSEAGDADAIECRELDPDLIPLADHLKKDPRFSRGFNTLPTSIAMVELDRLVVSQIWVTPQFSIERARAMGLGPEPDPETLFRFCLPLDREEAPVRIERLASNRYLFSSDSTDLRSYGATLLRAAQISDYDEWGTAAGVLGIGVGFGSNFLMGVRSDSRILLQNGYHRAHSLRSLGVTHAPCIVKDVTRRDELKLVASESVCDAPEFYFGGARPPMLKDFFDPMLTRTFSVRPSRTMVEVEVKIREFGATE